MIETCAALALGSAQGSPGASILDPMQNEATARLHAAVDRARAQCHRLFNRCVAELRKLQTARQVRNECHEAGEDISHLGLCDLRLMYRTLREQSDTRITADKVIGMEAAALYERQLAEATAIPEGALPSLSYFAERTQTLAGNSAEPPLVFPHPRVAA